MIFSQVVLSPLQGRYLVVKEFQAAWIAGYSNKAFSYGGLEGYITAKALTTVLKAAAGDYSTANLIRCAANLAV